MKNIIVQLSIFILVLNTCFAQQKPNILIIMADDLDSRQVSCYAGTNMQTPHIDRLAAEGLKFNAIIASEAMCIPTRASLFTGLYPARHGAYQNHKPVNSGIKSITHYLKDVGYRVALSGKDHMTKPKETFPFEIIPGFQTDCVASDDTYSLDSISDFIVQSQDPFCLFVMSINPHIPWNAGDPSEFDADSLKLPANWVDTKQTREDFRNYLAEIRRLDNQVGEVLRMLEEKDILDETLVIFLGEQGPQFPGGKWTLYDQGQKSSMLIRWPQKIKANTQTNALVQYEDILPTLLDFAGVNQIDSLDGRSFYPSITDVSKPHRQYAFGIHNNIPEGPAFPIRSIRDNQYKLIVNLSPEHPYSIKYMTNLKDPNLAFSTWVERAQVDSNAHFITERIIHHPEIEFYDLLKDPDELHNLANDQHYQQKIKEMKTELQKWMAQQKDRGVEMDVSFKN